MKMSQATILIAPKMHSKFSIAKNSKIAVIARVFFIQKTVWIFAIGDRIVPGSTKSMRQVGDAPISFSAMNHGTAIKNSSTVISACSVPIFSDVVASGMGKMQF